jgi:hypothetical protein
VGEGEIKFLWMVIQNSTINGTGTEDYFAAPMILIRKKNAAGVDVVDYTEFSTAYAGLHQVSMVMGIQCDATFRNVQVAYNDPIRFEKI